MQNLFDGVRRPSLRLPKPVQRQVLRDPHAPGLDVFDVAKLLPAIPHFNENLLHHVLRILRAAQKPEGEAIKLVFYRKNEVLESLQSHRLREEDGKLPGLLQREFKIFWVDMPAIMDRQARGVSSSFAK